MRLIPSPLTLPLMDLDDLRAAKFQLASDIEQLLEAFSDSTSLRINAVNVSSLDISSYSTKQHRYLVSLDIHL